MKAAFTRGLNKTGHMSHHATSSATKRKTSSVSDSQDMYGNEEVEEEEEVEEDITKDPMIRAVKEKGKGKMNGGKGSVKEGGVRHGNGRKKR